MGEVIEPAGGTAPKGGAVEMPRLPELDWDLPDEPLRRLETSWYPAQELAREGRRIEEHGDHVAMRTEGTLRGKFELADPVTAISIWAWGREARGEAPRARVWLNGEFVGEFEAQSPELREYTFPVWGEPTEVELRVKFVNDYFGGHGDEDRDLFVHGVTITTLAPES